MANKEKSRENKEIIREDNAPLNKQSKLKTENKSIQKNGKAKETPNKKQDENAIKKLNSKKQQELLDVKIENEKFKRYEEVKSNENLKKYAKEKKLSNKIYLISVIVLSLLFLISVFINIWLGLEINKANQLEQITFTKKLEVEATDIGSSVTSVTVPNHVLPGVGYQQEVKVTTPVLEHNLVVRAKIVFTDVEGNNLKVEAATTPNWQLGADGYYYFKGVLVSNNSYLFSTDVKLPKDINEGDDNRNSHVITFICESVRYDNASASVIWKTAPEDWLITYGSGVSLS